MYIQKFSLTTILTLIHPFFSPHILSAATLNFSNFLSLSQTTSIHQLPTKSLSKVQQNNAFVVLSKTFCLPQFFDNAQLKDYALIDIAYGYVFLGEKEKASEILSQTLQIAQSNEDEHWRGQALIKTGARYLADGQEEKAFEILNEGLQTIQETRGMRSLTYYLSEQELELIAQAYAAAEQYDPVLLISATKDSETVARILHATSRKIALRRQYERAFKLAQALKWDWGKSRVLADVIEVAVEAGHYEEILKAAQALESNLGKDYALVVIADYYAATGQYNQALELVQTVDNAYKAQSLVSIANYLGVVGQKERASELLIQALQINQNLPLENQLSMVEIAIGLAAAGQYDQALKLASTHEPSGDPEEGMQWALEEKTLALAGIAAYYAANEQRENALKVLSRALEFDKIASRWYRCPVKFVRPMLYEIANRYAAMGQYDQSLQIGQISQDESFKLKLLNEVIPNYVEASKKKSRQIRLASIPGGQCGG